MNIRAHRIRRRPRIVAAAALVLGFTLFAAACGGSETSAPESTPTQSDSTAAPTETEATSAPTQSASTPASTPQSTPESTPGSTPQSTPESTPGSTPQSTPESTPASTPQSTPESTPAPTPEPTPLPDSDLPSVEMVNVATGATVNLASFAPSDRPIVLWFWAPH